MRISRWIIVLWHPVVGFVIRFSLFVPDAETPGMGDLDEDQVDGTQEPEVSLNLALATFVSIIF